METKQRELISRAEYARRKDVAPRTIGKYTQKKIIPLHGNLIDPVEADACLEKYLKAPLGSGRVTPKTAAPVDGSTSKPRTTFSEAQTREKELKIELLELDLALKKSEMVLTKDVEFTAFTAARNVRDKMLNIPDRVSAIIAAETDETKVREFLIAQIENELASIAGAMANDGD